MLDFPPGTSPASARWRRSSASRTVRRRSRPRWRSRVPRRRARSSAYPADCDFFERVHIRADDPRGGLRASWATSSARRRWPRCQRPDAPALGGQVRAHRDAATKGGAPVAAGSPDLVDARGGRGRARWRSSRPTARCAPSPGRTPPQRPGLVQARLGHRRRGPAAAWPTPATCSTRPGRRPTARSCRSTGSWTRTSRRSTSRPTRSRCSRGWSRSCRRGRGRRLRGRSWSTRSGSTPSRTPNYGKAARRMYNVFRLTGRYREAAYLRELFDEPVTALYQVAALLRTARRRRGVGRRCSTASAGRPGRPADHVGHRRARRPGRGADGRQPPRAARLAAGPRVARGAAPTR